MNIVQEHDEIKNDYDEAYEIELQISKKYLYLSYILMALGITIVVFAILNCSVNALLLGAFNSMILVLIILLGYMLLVMSVALFRNKQELDELHKKIDDVEQDSLDISSINDWDWLFLYLWYDKDVSISVNHLLSPSIVIPASSDGVLPSRLSWGLI